MKDVAAVGQFREQLIDFLRRKLEQLQCAYAGVFELRRTAKWLAWFAVFVSVVISIFASRSISDPVKTLTESSRPLIGALAAGLWHDWFWEPHLPLKTDEFTALGLDPARPRLLCFVQRERKLAGSVVTVPVGADAVNHVCEAAY